MIHKPHLAVIIVISEINSVYMSREAEQPRLWGTKDSNQAGLASSLSIQTIYTHTHFCVNKYTDVSVRKL